MKYGENNRGIHLMANLNGGDTALCGQPSEGGWEDGADIITGMRLRKRGPVTCPECIAIIKWCQGVRTNPAPNNAIALDG
jgi:hypothetical protein